MLKKKVALRTGEKEMIEFFQKLFTSDFMPHGTCYLWNPPVLWLNVIADSVIALAYFAIPFLLFYFARKRKDLSFDWIFVAFAVFIFACGTTHVLGVWTVWRGTYRLDGFVKAITAVASIGTAILLVPLMPKLVRIPSPAQLEGVNQALTEEMARRNAVEDEVRTLNVQLEEKVAGRTGELEKSNRELSEALSRFRFLADAMPQIVWTAGRGGEVDFYNARWYEYTGAVNGQTDGRGWHGVVHPGDMEATLERLAASQEAGVPMEAELRIRRSSDGSYRWHLARSVPRRDAAGEIVQWVGTSTDIDEQRRLSDSLAGAIRDLTAEMKRRKETEEQLLQAQKMEAVGRLAGGVAHDFNNMLTGILGFNGLLMAQEAVAGDEQLSEFARLVKESAERASALTNQLLAFSRRQIVQPRVLDLNQSMLNMEKMLQRIIGADVELQTKLAAGVGRIHADPTHIDQIVLNLAVNARDAMPNGGKLTIETSKTVLTADYVDRHIGVEPGPYVVLTISDNGAGMDDYVRSRLFEPFFTTKEKDKGTGLGLSIVYGIVKQNRGEIVVHSNPGKGSTFKIFFPSTDAEESEVKRAPASAMPHGRETILLVEDEEVVRALVHMVLDKRGYKIIDARTGQEGLELAGAYPEPIHLLLADVVLPQMNGPALADRLRSSHPRMKVLFMSGYTGAGAQNAGLIQAGADLLDKPFTALTLSQKVREVLDRNALS